MSSIYMYLVNMKYKEKTLYNFYCVKYACQTRLSRIVPHTDMNQKKISQILSILT